jgi:hypothetical protein
MIASCHVVPAGRDGPTIALLLDMRPSFRSLASFGLATVSGLGLLACGSDTDRSPPPDLDGAAVHHYRITSIEVPDSPQLVELAAFDLDGDGTLDNQLASAYSSMQQQDSLYEVEGPSALRLTDDVGWVLSLYDGRGVAGARLARGVIVDGHALPLDEVEPATGPSLDAPFVLTGGAAMLPLGTLTDALGDRDAGWESAVLTQIAVESFGRDTARVRVGLALPAAEIRPVIVSNLAAFFTAALAAGHSEYGEIVDDNGDGVVSEAELESDALFQGLMNPDVVTDAGDAISMALWLIATPL